jgi:hypothetical protein
MNALQTLSNIPSPSIQSSKNAPDIKSRVRCSQILNSTPFGDISNYSTTLVQQPETDQNRNAKLRLVRKYERQFQTTILHPSKLQSATNVRNEGKPGTAVELRRGNRPRHAFPLMARTYEDR